MSIECNNVNFTYFEDRKNTLTDINCSFSADKIRVLTGASGCGKSTLLYLLAGIYPHNAGVLKSGTITIEGVVPDSLSNKDRCQLVGMMFQNPELQFCMDTVHNEMIFCLENICEAPEKMDARIDEALDFCEIKHLKERTLLSLSGGERQKVMLACMVMLEPKWLLLDEPFANIDDQSARAIAGKLKDLHIQKGTGILAVDHRLDNWLEVADEVCILQEGSLSPEVMVVKNLKSSRLEELGIIVPGSRYPVVEQAIREDSQVTLAFEGLSMEHEGKSILKGINAEFRSGHIYAIVGQSGCGKSSLFGAISGLYRYQGQIYLEGKPYNPNKRKDLGKIGFVTQNPQDQFVADRVRDEIMVSLRRKPEAEKECEEILRSIKLWRYRDISAYMLSQGQQRRLGTAALMAYDCRVLLCDEPTYAQDRNNTIAIMEGLCRQARERGVALVFTTHDPALARDYADKIYELKEGQLYEKN